MNTLKLSNGLALPRDTVTQKLAWIGTTGSGKTYGASKLAEQFWNIGAQFVVMDPVGVWYGLRLAKDGKKPSTITVPIFGGLHGDVPLESTGGALLANLVVDNDLSCVIDVSQFESDTEKARFATDFADRLFFRKKAAPSAMHFFVEECQEFVPQNPQRGEERMLHAFTRMQKLGRNFGIGSSYITQRPQEVNKKALNMAQTLFVFRTTGTHERTAIEKWIEDKSLDQSIASDLPKLETGTCHVWSPEFLKVSETTRINEKETFNASATPEVGVVAKKRELAPIDLEKVRTEMAATIEKAERDDPKLLRKKIAALEKARSEEEKHPLKPVTEKVVKVPVIKDAQIDRLEKIAERMYAEANRHGAAMELLWGNFDKIGEALADSMLAVAAFQSKKEEVTVVVPGTRVSLPQEKKNPPREGITGPEQRILNAIAWAVSIGIDTPGNPMIAFLSGYTNPKSTGYTNPRGNLVAKGLIHYPQAGFVSLTDAGREVAEWPDTVPSEVELHRRVLERLTGPQARILRVLLEARGEPVQNEVLAGAAGYNNVKSTGYTNPRGDLRSYGLIEYSPSGVYAESFLFL